MWADCRAAHALVNVVTQHRSRRAWRRRHIDGFVSQFASAALTLKRAGRARSDDARSPGTPPQPMFPRTRSQALASTASPKSREPPSPSNKTDTPSNCLRHAEQAASDTVTILSPLALRQPHDEHDRDAHALGKSDAHESSRPPRTANWPSNRGIPASANRDLPRTKPRKRRSKHQSKVVERACSSFHFKRHSPRHYEPHANDSARDTDSAHDFRPTSRELS